MKFRSDGIVASILLLLSMVCVLVLDGALNHRYWADGFFRWFSKGIPIWIFVGLSCLCFCSASCILAFRRSNPKAVKAILMASLLLSLAWPVFVGWHYFADQWHQRRDRDYKKTMACIRELAMLWLAYEQQYSIFLPPDKDQMDFDWGNVSERDLVSMFRSLSRSSAGMENLKLKDAWGWDLQFCAFGKGKHSGFAIRSPGRDGQWDADRYEIWPWATGDYDRDIVFSNGIWIRWQRGEAGGRGPVPKRHPGEQILWFPDIYTDSP